MSLHVLMQASVTYTGNVVLRSLAASSGAGNLVSCVIGAVTSTPSEVNTRILEPATSIACTFSTTITAVHLSSGAVPVQATISGTRRPASPTLATESSSTLGSGSVAVAATSPVVTITQELKVGGVVKNTYTAGERVSANHTEWSVAL
jgi:hypothetical protein